MSGQEQQENKPTEWGSKEHYHPPEQPTASEAKKNGGPKSERPAEIDPAVTNASKWRPFLSLLNDAQIKDVEDRISLERFTVEIDGQPKVFTRRKVKPSQFLELESIRVKHNEAAAGTFEKARLSLEQYKRAAFFYLGMTDEEFEAADYEEVKRILDAQNLRTNYGSPNQKTSSVSFIRGGQD